MILSSFISIEFVKQTQNWNYETNYWAFDYLAKLNPKGTASTCIEYTIIAIFVNGYRISTSTEQVSSDCNTRQK